MGDAGPVRGRRRKAANDIAAALPTAKRLTYFGEGEADIAGFAPAAGETTAFGFGGIVPAAPG